jgi:hypothetical protein
MWLCNKVFNFRNKMKKYSFGQIGYELLDALHLQIDGEIAILHLLCNCIEKKEKNIFDCIVSVCVMNSLLYHL